MNMLIRGKLINMSNQFVKYVSTQVLETNICTSNEMLIQRNGY